MTVKARGLLAVGLVVTGCSFGMNVAPSDPSKRTHEAARKCTDGVFLPVADSLVAAVGIYNIGVSAAAQDKVAIYGVPIDKTAGLTIGITQLVVFGAAATYGYVQAARCNDLQRELHRGAMTHSLRLRPLSRRTLCFTFGATTLAACSASWLEKKKLGPIALPRVLSIMVYKSDRVRQNDENRVVDVVAKTIALEFRKRDITTDIVELAGPPHFPRVELAFWDVEGLPNSLTLDCAFVSETDDIAFIGRIVGRGDGSERTLCAKNAGMTIASALLGG